MNTLPDNVDILAMSDGGSMIGLTAMTDAARDWISENVATEAWQYFGNVLWIDVRCACDLIPAAVAAGLSVYDHERGFAVAA